LVLGNLGNAYKSLGQYQRAIDFQLQSLEIDRKIGDRGGEAKSLGNLGNAYDSLGQYQRAIDFQLQSLEIKREIGDRGGEANSLWSLANIAQQRGNLKRAMEYRHSAYAIWQELQLPLAALPIPEITKRMLASMDDGEWVDTIVQSEKAWLFLPMGYCLFIIRTILSPLSKIQKSLKISPFLFWFGIGLAICLLIWWVRK
jgi:tetratricopeptide (TPR) repeat protein